MEKAWREINKIAGRIVLIGYYGDEIFFDILGPKGLTRHYLEGGTHG